HKALNSKDVVVRPHTAPETGGNRGWFGTHVFDLEIRNVVGHVDGTVDRIDVNSVLKGGWKPASDHRRSGYLVFPGRHFTASERRGDGVAIGRAIDIVLDVFLTRPNHLDGLTVQVLRHAHGGKRHVRLEAATEAAADEMVVDGDFLNGQAGQLCHGALHARYHLRADPDLA